MASSDSGLELSSPPGPECEGLRTPPLDWSLKARARFTSRHSFGWTQVASGFGCVDHLYFPQHLTTVEEASGITGGVRCLGLSRYSLSSIFFEIFSLTCIQRRPLLKHKPQSPIACSHTLLAGDFSCTCTHILIFLSQHPSLPVPLFPRYSQSSLRTSAAPTLSLSPDMQVDTFSISTSSSYFYLNFIEGPPVRLDVIAAIGLPAGESTPVSLFLSSGTQFHSSVQGCRY